MYDTKEEANQKLHQTVVLFHDSPVWIIEAAGKGSKLVLRHKLLRTGEEHSNNINEEGWNFQRLGSRLGYVNIDNGKGNYQEAVYATRVPVRKAHSTQGLSSANVRFSSFRGSPKLGLPPCGVSWNATFQTKPFLDTLEGKWPSFADVQKVFKKDPYLVSKAFDKCFAVRRTDLDLFYMEYKGKDIGYSDDFEKWKIAKDFSYLHESLDNINVKIA